MEYTTRMIAPRTFVMPKWKPAAFLCECKVENSGLWRANGNA